VDHYSLVLIITLLVMATITVLSTRGKGICRKVFECILWVIFSLTAIAVITLIWHITYMWF